MTVRLVFSLHMLSDYHTAAGYGYGQTMDSALLKDDKGLPIIRGSSLSGLFRSAAKELTSAMGQYGERLIDSIFGNAGQKGQWAFGAARLAASARHMPLTQIRQGVRIDPALRRAQDKKLYALEVGSAGLTFEFDIEQLTPNETELDEAAVLVAAARLVRGLGAQVNRGAGRCLITLKAVTGHTGNLDQDGLLQHLGLVVKGAARKMQFDRQVAEPITPDGLSLSFRVLARNLEPLMISRQNHPGNGYDSLDYIPGNVFLGALASHYLAAGLAADQQFLELFRYGGVRVSPLYPAMVSGGRQLSPTIPIPADMLTCKRQGHFSTSPHSTDLRGYATANHIPETCPFCEAATPMVSTSGFLALAPSQSRVQARYTSQTHVAMRPGERHGADEQVYSYQALDPGQYFIGQLRFANKEAAARVLGLFRQEGSDYELSLRLGKGTTRGYGMLQLRLQPNEDSPLNPLPLKQRIADIDKPITLTFLSDCILRDSWGRLISDLSSEALSEALGLDLEVRNVFVSVREIEGFDAVAGLPKSRDLAIKAGSAVGFQLKPGTDRQAAKARLAQLETEGLGFRRHQGYGQVAFAHVVYDVNQLDQASDTQITMPRPWRSRPLSEDIWRALQRELTLTEPQMLNVHKLNTKRAKRARELARLLYAWANKPVAELIALVDALGGPITLESFGIEASGSEPLFDEAFKSALKGDIKRLDSCTRTVLSADAPYNTPEMQMALRRRSLAWLGEKIMLAAKKVEGGAAND